MEYFDGLMDELYVKLQPNIIRKRGKVLIYDRGLSTRGATFAKIGEYLTTIRQNQTLR